MPRCTAALLVALVLVVACTSTSDPQPAGPGAAPATSAAAHAPDDHHPPLPNVHRLTDRVISGGVPGGEPAFAELAAMGVKTVISVDGATPDVEGAKKHGLRYVHIPTTYSQVSDAQRLELARAIRDLPGPVYVHCHHGKHRSPAAVAAAGVALGLITPEQGIAFMKQAGTAPNYEGLYACVTVARQATPAELDAAPAGFPAAREAEGIVAAMIEVDLAFENLGHVKTAGWKVPRDHPDLVPAAEAGRLTDNLRLSVDAGRGDEFMRRLKQSIDQASALEEALVADAPAADLEARWKLVSASCKDCHKTYRDRK